MITREDKIEQSLYDFVVDGVRALNYDATLVQFREAFPTYDERATELDITTVSFSVNFDDGGELIEIGSDLTERVYTAEWWTFGTDQTIGRNVANVIRKVVEGDYGLVPLKDIGQDPAPVIDQLQVEEVSVNRQLANDPQPWDEFVWSTTAKIMDTYYPSQQ